MPNPGSADGPINVLIVDDQEWSSRSWASVFETHGLTVRTAFTGQQCLDLARALCPEVIVLDRQLPDMDGLEVCRHLRDGHDGAITPIVLTTSGTAGRADRLAAYEAGAWEFCTHPVDIDALLVKVGTFMRARRAFEQTRSAAHIDSSTGLYSPSGLAVRARELGAAAARTKTPLACVALTVSPRERAGVRLDRGWLGDSGNASEMLGKVSRWSARTSDIVGRLGTADVAILAPATDAVGVRHLVDRIQKSLDKHLNALGSTGPRSSIRAGFSAVDDVAGSGIDPADLLRRASSAMRASADGSAASLIAFEDLATDGLAETSR